MAMAAVAAASVSGVATEVVALIAALVAVFATWHAVLLGWRSLILTILLVVLFVPIKRYRLPASLPFDLELYRVTVALVLAIWLASLLVDPRVRLRRSPFDAPLGLFGLAVIGSVLANPGRAASLGAEVSKSLTFLLSFILVYYLVVSVVGDTRAVLFLTRVTVAGIAVIAAFAILERQTGYNIFFHLQSVFPFLQFQGGDVEERAGRLRVFGSSQHPIALGAAFAVAVPLAVAFAHIGRRVLWLSVAALLLLGTLATTSRTAVVMLVVIGIVLFVLRKEATKKLIPLAVPALVAAYVITPGAVGSLRDAFFPSGGLIAQQTRLPPNGNPLLAGGRIRLLGPSLEEWRARPILGQGWGTRITGFDNPLRNAPILDNAWLAALLEVGAVGVGALVWLLVRAVRMLGELARSSTGEDGWLAAGMAASIAAIAFGMFTFDTFSFIQIAFLFWILLGLGAALLSAQREPVSAPPVGWEGG